MPLSRVQPAWRPTLLALLFLAGIALATTWWHRQLAASLRDYRAPGPTLAVRPLDRPGAAPGEGSAALTSPPVAQQVILIVASGLRADAARRLPTLADLAGRGARGEVMATEPGSLAATWGALLTGAPPEWSGAALADSPGSEAHPLAAVTLLAAARRAGLRAAIFGQGPWSSVLAGESIQGGAPTSYNVAAVADQATTQAAREALSRADVGLAVVGYGHVAQAAAAFGPRSAEYDRAAQTVDGQVQDLLRGLDLRRSVVIVTGDRGLTDAPEGEDAAHAPFVMLGGAVRSGDFGRMPQLDIAPTAAALLGLGPPMLAQGVARGDMLQTPDEVRALVAVADARQKLAVERAAAGAYGADRDRQVNADEIAGLPVVQTALALGNNAAGWRLAEPTVREAQRRLESIRERAVAENVDGRTLPFLALMAGLVVAAAWRATATRALMIGAALVALLGPLDALNVPRPTSFALPLAGAAAVAAGLVWLWRGHDSRAARLTVAGAVGLAALTLGAWITPSADLGTLAGWGSGLRGGAWPTLLALVWGGAAAVAVVWWRDEGDVAAQAAWLAAQFCLALVGLLAAELAFFWWQAGTTITGFLPPLSYVVGEMLTLTRLQTVAVGGLLLPWLAAAAALAGVLRWEEVGQPAHGISLQ
ncbi:MAG: alkaline phosphatase family protein [Anaerolineae bacterium]|nr:alkaline phosphatase family protein [Anaerolineae bacterium]